MGNYRKASDIKAGVIGYGGAFNMGQAHLAQMSMAGMTPAAVVDVDKSRLAIAENDFPGIQTFTDIAAMLRDSGVDIVTVITPHNLHAKQVLQCLRAGCHCVVEKPMAITTKECDRMIAEAHRRELVLSTYHNRHWDGCILEAMKHVRAGEVGEVVRVEVNWGNRAPAQEWWRSSKNVSGGLLYDWGVHLLEYALQIVNDDLAEVSGFLKEGYWSKTSPWKKDTVEDEGTVVARFKGGAWLTLNMTQLNPLARPFFFEVVGTLGTYRFNHQRWQLTRIEDGTTVTTEGTNTPDAGHLFYQNVADHLVKDKKLVITPEWSRRPIHVIDLACQSARKGKALAAKHA